MLCIKFVVFRAPEKRRSIFSEKGETDVKSKYLTGICQILQNSSRFDVEQETGVEPAGISLGS